MTKDQENCPYCHYPYKRMQINNNDSLYPADTNIFSFYTDIGFGFGILEVFVLEDNGTEKAIGLTRDFKYCKKCGRNIEHG